MKRTILVVISDTHANNKLGLLNPDTVLFDEPVEGQEAEPYTPKLGESQKYLWKLYKKNIKKIEKLAGGDAIVVVHNGDLTQGRKYMSRWVSTLMADEIEIARMNMIPLMEMKGLKAMRFVFGTASHVWGSGSSEQVVARHLQDKYPKIDVDTYYHGVIDIDGMLVDVAHHGPNQSSRAWLEGRTARYYLQSLMTDEILNESRPPDLVVRSHYHTKIDEVVRVGKYESRIIVTPAMCMLGDYARQATRSIGRIINGMAAFEIMDGRVMPPVWLTKKKDVRVREKI